MKTDLDLIVADVSTKCRQLKIVPIFDVHIGAKEFCESEFVDYLNKYKDDPDAYFIIGGDIINNSIRTSIANPYAETMRPSEQKRYACKLLEPIKDRILCAVSGNHEQRSRKEVDEDIIYDICAKLDIEDRYRENMAFVLLRVPKATRKDGRNWCYTIGVTHGGGNTRKATSLGYAIDNLDVLVVGHTHKPDDMPSAKLSIDIQNKKITRKQFGVLVASSWLEWGGYSARGMYLPTARVSQEILLDTDQKHIEIKQGW